MSNSSDVMLHCGLTWYFDRQCCVTRFPVFPTLLVLIICCRWHAEGVLWFSSCCHIQIIAQTKSHFIGKNFNSYICLGVVYIHCSPKQKLLPLCMHNFVIYCFYTCVLVYLSCYELYTLRPYVVVVFKIMF